MELKIGKKYVQTVVNPDKFIAGKWTYVTEYRDVSLLAVAGIWAMVRRPRAVPYVCQTKDLSEMRGK